MKLNCFSLSVLSSAVALAMVNPAVAQHTPDSVIEEITVTAQKREQAMQDVPVTMSAYDGAFLDELGIAELDALSDVTPGLVIQEQSPNNPGFVIRGITSDSGSAQSAPRVSVYYNGADVSRSRGSYFELFDIERIEVVKGPQATLFGTAASVGALSVYTAKPTEDFSANMHLSLGNFSAKTAKGYITGGNETLQGRFAFSYRKRDGFIENIAGRKGSQSAGGIKQDDMHAIERTAFRPSIRFTPNENVTVDLVYSYEKNQDSGTAFKNGLFAPTGGNTSPFTFVEMAGSPLSAKVLGAEKLGLERTVNDLNMTVNWDVSDTLTFTSISAKRSFESLEVFDADGTQAWFLEFAEDAEGDQFSQEFRLVQSDAQMTAIYGLSYFSEDGSQRVPFSTEEGTYLNCLGFLAALKLPCIRPDGTVPNATLLVSKGALTQMPYSANFSNFGDNSAWSAFADITYAVTDALELTAGLRYVSEDKTSGYQSNMPNSALIGRPLLPVANTGGAKLEADASFDDWLPRLNALYVLNNNINMYATVSKGRRSNVLDVNATVDKKGAVTPRVKEVPAEIVWNYEFGVKGENANRTLNYSASIFYQDYSDFQVTLQDSAGRFYTANAGSATNIGLEAELRAIVGSGIELFANFAYIDAEIDDDSSNGNLAGNRFRLQPEYTASLGAFYSTPLSSGYELTSSLVYSYRSEVFFEPENKPISGLDISQGAVNLVNAKIGIVSNENWSVGLFVTNLFDKDYLVDAGNTGGSFRNPTFVAAPPRFYGIEFSYRFGE